MFCVPVCGQICSHVALFCLVLAGFVTVCPVIRCFGQVVHTDCSAFTQRYPFAQKTACVCPCFHVWYSKLQDLVQYCHVWYIYAPNMAGKKYHYGNVLVKHHKNERKHAIMARDLSKVQMLLYALALLELDSGTTIVFCCFLLLWHLHAQFGVITSTGSWHNNNDTIEA